MFSFLNNIPVVTRNLLIINVLLYFISIYLLSSGGINLFNQFAVYPIGSPHFQPYQVVTHLFMHSQQGISHILMNMFGLVIFGGFLERRFGSKRFFIFYFLCGIGAYLLGAGYHLYQLTEMKNRLLEGGFDLNTINNYIAFQRHDTKAIEEYLISTYGDAYFVPIPYINMCLKGSIGASGAIFGILGAFAILFPNTELYLMFIPVPIKAKYLIGFYLAYEVYQFIYPSINDNIDHLAHICGASIGIAYVLINRRIDRQHFF